MRTLLSEQYAPITSQIGFVRAGKPETVDALVRWRPGARRRRGTDARGGRLPGGAAVAAAAGVAHPVAGVPEPVAALR